MRGWGGWGGGAGGGGGRRTVPDPPFDANPTMTDYRTGLCRCFDGFHGENCGNITTWQVEL